MSDLDQIKKIEQELNVELKQLDEIDKFSRGYTVNQDGAVNGVGLCDCKSVNLKHIIAPLIALMQLTQLNLRGNQISDLTPLAELPQLTQLNLSDNHLSDLTPLKALWQLTQLFVSGNQINDLTSLAALTRLSDLHISRNQIHDLAPLSMLSHLTQLTLYNNQISDLTPLAALTQLAHLNLKSNQISDLTPLAALTQLTTLSLYDNQISDLMPLSNMKKLTQLHLGGNTINNISPLNPLKDLEVLGLWKNQIIDITPLKNLKKLTTLHLMENPIEELPSWITNFEMEIRWQNGGTNGYITFYGNPLKNPPPEIVKQGKAAIRNYFAQLQAQAEDYLFEAKMLIVGEPAAGKTSLAWKMHDATCELPKEDATTRGIEVNPYYFPLQPDDFKTFKHPEKLTDRDFRLNLWDFGGQEIYKATHRFFLSKRALYSLVADSRNEDTDFNYWLHIVEMFGGDSPLLIVLNEKHGRKRNLDVAAMRARFGNIVDVLDVDLAEHDHTRLHKLIQAVKYRAAQLPHIGNPVPAKWAEVRETIEQDERHTITIQEYLTICKDKGIPKREDAMVLSQYFHDIGVFLHFQEDDLLSKTIFLKPNWATNAVYQLLDAPLLNQTNGRFTKQDATALWCDAEHAPVCHELLRLMHKFFLAYKIPDSDTYIVPERLPAAAPQYEWDSRDNLLLHYFYDVFMPKGILSQFIVQMHRYIQNHDLVWRRGVILEREQTRAEVVESYDARRFTIRLAGKHCRDFMTIITEQLDQINGQFEKMQVDKLIPCNCAECQASGDPYFFEYKKLQRRLERGRQEIECEHSYEMVNVRSLIDDVINIKHTRAERGDRERRQLPFPLQQEIVDLLTGLPNLDEPSARRAFVTSAGLDQHLHKQLDFALPPAQFCQLLVRTLDDYGSLADGRSALAAILEAAKNYVGQEGRDECERLKQEVEESLGDV